MASVMGRVSPSALLYLPESSGPCSGPTPGPRVGVLASTPAASTSPS